MVDQVYIEGLVHSLGGDFFGVADLSPARELIKEQGGAVISSFPRAISIGIGLFDPIVDQLPQRAEVGVAINYRHHCYDVINQRLDTIASHVSTVLQGDGYRAFPIPASKRVDDERLMGTFSHKLAAHLSGLGWIGKSCLLITPERGPRVRWASVLTDSPLEITGKVMDEKCGTCTECVDICPVKAFTGEPFHVNEPREVRYDAGKCDRYFTAMKSEPHPAVCGMCLYICPYGRHKID